MIPDAKIIYRLFDRQSGDMQKAYSRSYHDEEAWECPASARNSHCSGMFENREKYRVAKYKVTYELIEEDCL